MNKREREQELWEERQDRMREIVAERDEAIARAEKAEADARNLRNVLADNMDREGKLENRISAWYMEWCRKMGEDTVPDLQTERDLYDAGKAILDPPAIDDLPEMPVEKMARECIEESNKVRERAARAEKAEAACAAMRKFIDATPIFSNARVQEINAILRDNPGQLILDELADLRKRVDENHQPAANYQLLLDRLAGVPTNHGDEPVAAYITKLEGDAAEAALKGKQTKQGENTP